MRVLPRGVNNQVRDVIESISSTYTVWRVVYFEFSRAPTLISDFSRFQIFTTLLLEPLRELEGFALPLGNHDFVLIAKGISKQQIETTRAAAGVMLKDSTVPVASLITVYDLSHQLADFRQKIDNALSSHPTPVEKKDGASLLNDFLQSLQRTGKEFIDKVLNRRHSRKERYVLLVEDDHFSRRLVRNAIGRNYTIVEADSGIGALENYFLHAPDIVFLDIDLPDIDGQQVLKTIRQYDPHAFVVMLSGNSYKDYVINAMREGAKGFVSKPFPKDKLLHYISTACPAV